MASTATISGSGSSESTSPPRIVRLWRDTTRVEQLARLKSLQLQADRKYGDRAWELAHEQWRQLPDDARIDLPSRHVFAKVLGLFRTGATIKTGKLLRLELSAQDIADLLGHSKSTIEAVLRWLGVGPIEYRGDQLARGLGILHRGRRTAKAYLDGTLQRVYRTSRTVLTTIGRMLLGLGARDEERRREKHAARARRKAEASKSESQLEDNESNESHREREHIQGHGDDGGGQHGSVDDSTPEVGRHWLNKILGSL